MPLFHRRSGKANPTYFWIGDTRFPLEFDTEAHRISGVRPGGLLDPLAPLGPAEDRKAAEEGTLSWFSRGLEVYADQEAVTGFRLVWAGDARFQPFTGTCRRGSKLLPVGPETTEADLRRWFGAPYWRDEDEDEVLLFYEFGPVEWQVELTKQGTLAQWTVCAPPLMASEEQRRAYGVDRPWPPGLRDEHG